MASRASGEIFPRSRDADRAPRCAARVGLRVFRIPSIAIDRFLAFHLIDRPVRPFSPRDHVLTSSEPRSRPQPQVSGRSNSRASRRCVATMAGTGRFAVGAVHAEEMYDPDVYGRGLPAVLEVRP